MSQKIRNKKIAQFCNKKSPISKIQTVQQHTVLPSFPLSIIVLSTSFVASCALSVLTVTQLPAEAEQSKQHHAVNNTAETIEITGFVDIQSLTLTKVNNIAVIVVADLEQIMSAIKKGLSQKDQIIRYRVSQFLYTTHTCNSTMTQCENTNSIPPRYLPQAQVVQVAMPICYVQVLQEEQHKYSLERL